MHTFSQFTNYNRDLFGLMPDYLQISINFVCRSFSIHKKKITPFPFKTFYNFLHFDTLFNFFSVCDSLCMCVRVLYLFIFFLSFIRLFFFALRERLTCTNKTIYLVKIQFTQTLYYF